MKFLAIDTGAKRLTVAAVNRDAEAVIFEDCAMQHSVKLFDAVEEALSRVRMSLSEVDLIACVVGPGSFTGIRIGISAVKGMCFALEKPVLPVTSFETIAYAERNPKAIAVVDAGHGYVYAEGFGVALPQGYYPLEEAAALAAHEGAPLLSNEPFGAVRAVNVCEGLMNAVKAKYGHTMSARELAALYLRKSSAEEGR